MKHPNKLIYATLILLIFVIILQLHTLSRIDKLQETVESFETMYMQRHDILTGRIRQIMDTLGIVDTISNSP